MLPWQQTEVEFENCWKLKIVNSRNKYYYIYNTKITLIGKLGSPQFATQHSVAKIKTKRHCMLWLQKHEKVLWWYHCTVMVPDYGTLKYTENCVPWCIHSSSKNITVLLWDILITLCYNVYGMYVVLRFTDFMKCLFVRFVISCIFN